MKRSFILNLMTLAEWMVETSPWFPQIAVIKRRRQYPKR